MKKKKRIKIILTACFVLIAGILYTISYIKPLKKEAILLDGAKASAATEETAIDCANDSQLEEAEDDISNVFGNLEEAEDDISNVLDNSVEKSTIYIHICGAVKEPGVYLVSDGSRLDDVVTCAGGLTEDAASDYINLAQTVLDGQQYFIPNTQDVEGVSRLDYTDSLPASAGNTNTSIAGGKTNAENNSEKEASDYININTATREELMTLPGVGEAKAESILTYRETVSQYETIEDIMKVSGIKQGLFQKIKDQITVK